MSDISLVKTNETLEKTNIVGFSTSIWLGLVGSNYKIIIENYPGHIQAQAIYTGYYNSIRTLNMIYSQMPTLKSMWSNILQPYLTGNWITLYPSQITINKIQQQIIIKLLSFFHQIIYLITHHAMLTIFNKVSWIIFPLLDRYYIPYKF